MKKETIELDNAVCDKLKINIQVFGEKMKCKYGV